MHIPWLVVSGFGAHIKSTPRKLVIQRGGAIEEYPLESVCHLLLVGGHTLHTTSVAHLVNSGAFISFFEPDGEPVGFIRPFADRSDDELHAVQEAAPAHSYAVALARGAARSRLLMVESISELMGRDILYEGELQILHSAFEELENLIKMDEIRRVHRLTSDMYYEIMSRTVPPELGFRRRTSRPYRDVINSMLSLGYAMLFGNACVAVIGAKLDPDHGFLHKGAKSLVYDLIDPFKAKMIDSQVFAIAREQLHEDDFECTSTRCILSDPLMKRLIEAFRSSISQDILNKQALVLRRALLEKEEFLVLPQY